jgi:exosortase/archaeosortase family protein
MTPWGTIVIADGCSGLRYLVIALLIAYLLCLLNRYPIKISIMVLIIATFLGLITNWIRILIIILIGYYTEMQHSLVRDHEFFGWVLFAGILFPALYLSPQFRINPDPIAGKAKFSWVVIAAGLIGPLIYFSIPFSNNTSPIQLSTLDQQFARAFAKPALDIQYPQTGNIETSSIILNEVVINLSLVASAPNNKNEKIVSYFNKLYDNYYWKSIQQKNLPNSSLEVLENRSHQQKVILIYKFQVGSFTSSNYYQAKLLQIPAKLLNQAYFGLWIAQASCLSDCEQELDSIKKLDAHW